MCGIAGVVGRAPDEKLVPRMIEIMKHRGPDFQGFYRSENIHLGHCRLSINDLSDRAKQPFQSADKNVIVAVNGEIYNFRELKDLLIRKGYQFQSNSDCEVILHAYIDQGLDFIPNLNGMFAIAIWDERTGSLYLVRDRLGIKPLYYTLTKNAFFFASEIKALAVCSDVDLSIDLQSFGEYLVFENYFENRTLNQQIKLVEPGQIINFKRGDHSTKKNYFWQPYLCPLNVHSDATLYAEYLKIIEASVERHLISDVPIGCYLSSGIDSSSVTYWASKKLNGKLKTYTGYFGIKGFYDEATDAKQIADFFGCPNERVDIKPGDFVENIENVLYHLDEPRVGMGSFSQYMVAKRAAQEVKVIMTGHGGDEFFAGYPVFKAVYGKGNIFKLILSSSLREMMFFVYFSLFPLIREELRYFLPNIYPLTFLRRIMREDFFHQLKEHSDILAEPQRLEDQSSNEYERLFLTYLRYYLPALFIVEDKISMAFSLESRTPLCDNDLLELALRIPLTEKLRGYELKHIPRESMRGKLPDFIYRLPKRGFPTPLLLWFKRELKEYVRSFILDNFVWLEFFQRKEVERLIFSYQNSPFKTPYDEIKAHRIWILFNLIIYFRNQKQRYQRGDVSNS
jgi:asparagine synthase (glutamine-hydrolysing)